MIKKIYINGNHRYLKYNLLIFKNYTLIFNLKIKIKNCHGQHIYTHAYIP